MKLAKNNLANSFALATAILWVVCTGFVAVFPYFSQTVTQWWMHGMEVAGFNLSWSLEYVEQMGKKKSFV